MTEIKIDNQKISELEGLPDSSGELLNLSSLFMISEQKSDTSFISKHVSCDLMLSNFIKTIEKIDYFAPTGNWLFVNGGEMTIPTKTIEKAYKAGEYHCVVNLDYLSSSFLKVLYRLSSDFLKYTPSFVGEVIFTTALGNESAVRRQYGKHTRWKKVSGRFILGTGGLGGWVSDIKDGEDKTEITLERIPPHYHTFEPSEEKEEFEASYTMKGRTTDDIVELGEWGPSLDGGPTGMYAVSSGPPQTVTPSSEVTESANLYGEDGADIKVVPNRGKDAKHNNIPPYFSVYAWERIS